MTLLQQQKEYMNEEKRDTVGALATALQQKTPDSRDPIELEREMHKPYEESIFDCIERNKGKFYDPFFIVVLTKKERLLPNVLRNYFFARQTCPTPEYDQTLYRYTSSTEKLEFVWVIPSKDTCEYLRYNALQVAPEEKQLLDYVMMFEEGTLLKVAKRMNNEQENSILLVN